MGWTGRNSGDTSVAVVHEAIHNLTSACPEELSAAIAFGNLGALVLGDHPLYLNQQRCFRIVVKRRSIQILDLDSVPGQLVSDQDLVSIAASQPVGRQAPDLLEQAGFGRVAKCIQTRAVKSRSGVAIARVF